MGHVTLEPNGGQVPWHNQEQEEVYFIVEGTGEMRLSGPTEGPTTMDYTATVDLFGSLAGIGSRMIEGTAAKIIDETFDCVRAKVAPAPA